MATLTSRQTDALVELLRAELSGVLAVYLFGSQASGLANDDSDTDIAVLVAGYSDPVTLFELAGKLGDIVRTPVDLVDFRAATTVLQAQILNEGRALWRAHSDVESYEAGVLRDKYDLDIRRQAQLDEIKERGSVYAQ